VIVIVVDIDRVIKLLASKPYVPRISHINLISLRSYKFFFNNVDCLSEIGGRRWKFYSKFLLHRRSFSSIMDKRTKELFEWAASNSTASTTAQTEAPRVPSTTLNPSIIDAILGPDDATLMIDSMKAIKDVSLPVDDRYIPPTEL